jgi:hypothetical protein
MTIGILELASPPLCLFRFRPFVFFIVHFSLMLRAVGYTCTRRLAVMASGRHLVRREAEKERGGKSHLFHRKRQTEKERERCRSFETIATVNVRM